MSSYRITSFVSTPHFPYPFFSSSASAENCLAAIVGKEITAKFSFPFVDYCPEKMNMKYVIDVRNFLALRVWLPAQSPLAPVLHSLMKNAHFTCSQPAATALPTISSPSQVTSSSLILCYSAFSLLTVSHIFSPLV